MGVGIIFSRGDKSGKICFIPLEIMKTIFSAQIFKIQGAALAPLPPLPTPMFPINFKKTDCFLDA